MNVHRKTRNDYLSEQEGIVYPVSLVAINFHCDGNLGFLTRAAACFGASEVVVIGHLPTGKRLRQFSANTSLQMKYRSFSTPTKFLESLSPQDKVVSVEIGPDAVDLNDYPFSTENHTYIVVGNETTGVPVEICINSDMVYIPMPGVGRCLNTSQAGHLALYEYVKKVSL